MSRTVADLLLWDELTPQQQAAARAYLGVEEDSASEYDRGYKAGCRDTHNEYESAQPDDSEIEVAKQDAVKEERERILSKLKDLLTD